MGTWVNVRTFGNLTNLITAPEPKQTASNVVVNRKPVFSAGLTDVAGHGNTKHEVSMYKVVGFGLIFLLVGYVAWLATGGTGFTGGGGETVVIDRGDGSGSQVSEPQEFRIVTLLGFDGIRSIEDPRFVTPDVADETYDPTELILGVEIDGDARAYSVPLLSRHEIVNDVVGGKPIAVTW